MAQLSDREKLLTRVKGLLDLSKGQTGDGYATENQKAATFAEAKAAAALAQKLILQYQISHKELNEIHKSQSDIIEVRIEVRGLLKFWQRTLATVVTMAIGENTKLLHQKSNRRGGTEYLVFVGASLNIQVLEQLYISLRNQLEQISERDWNTSVTRYRGGNKTVFLNSFFSAAVMELWLKFSEMRTQVEHEQSEETSSTPMTREEKQEQAKTEATARLNGNPTTSSAIVPLFSDHEQAVNDYIGRQFNVEPEKKTHPKKRQRNREGLDRGERAGRDVNGFNGLKSSDE